MYEISIVYTSMSSQDEAEQLATIAIESRLAACINILPKMTSIYQWDNQIEKSSEYALIFKTSTDNQDNLVRLIEANHPYDVPAILISRPNTTTDFYAYIQAHTHKPE